MIFNFLLIIEVHIKLATVSYYHSVTIVFKQWLVRVDIYSCKVCLEGYSCNFVIHPYYCNYCMILTSRASEDPQYWVV